MFIDYYAILEISSTAELDEIKAAFKKQALKWHPDKNPSIDTTLKMQQINEAYLILKEPDARERYDIEYVKFNAYKRKKETKTEAFSQEYQNAKENKSNEYQDYTVEDETLYRWMTNAKKQAVDLAKQTIEEKRVLSKVGIKEGGKAIGKQIIGYVVVGIIVTIFFSLSRGCNQIKESERIEQTFAFSSAASISLKKGEGSSNSNISGEIKIEKDAIIVDADNGSEKTHDICQIKSVKYKNKPDELEYLTNAGFFYVTLDKGIAVDVSLGTTATITIFKK